MSGCPPNHQKWRLLSTTSSKKRTFGHRGYQLFVGEVLRQVHRFVEDAEYFNGLAEVGASSAKEDEVPPFVAHVQGTQPFHDVVTGLGAEHPWPFGQPCQSRGKLPGVMVGLLGAELLSGPA